MCNTWVHLHVPVIFAKAVHGECGASLCLLAEAPLHKTAVCSTYLSITPMRFCVPQATLYCLIYACNTSSYRAGRPKMAESLGHQPGSYNNRLCQSRYRCWCLHGTCTSVHARRLLARTNDSATLVCSDVACTVAAATSLML
jgi:hypothetical protein